MANTVALPGLRAVTVALAPTDATWAKPDPALIDQMGVRPPNAAPEMTLVAESRGVAR